ncbi:DUF1206 domain-containing protein [Jeotgalibacillus haloalkalitolerans]|uniref:DUF1206 domain-containing protein n=1 Tax=Jeotgalibacillus haloalkalitolerans TaxID=3104292 RepID=A0ABU5KQB7_9BACL|nr:DUF1206 domain-containing protein [Jeotgalibacillus sp. HH7-29]MDZ5713342.1 DUF1206 domain-containing protein [Jeotgalibacillus sp. HH7-29]
MSQLTMKSNDTSEEVKPWVRRLGRFGYMSKGAVYGIVGILALLAALGVGGETTDTSGALQQVATLPFGEVLLWIVGIGLFFYVMWEIVRAIFDPQHKGNDAKGIATRIAYAVSGVIYAGLAVSALQIAMNAGSGGGNSEQTISAMLLGQPFGQWLVGILGAGVIIYGLYNIYTGYKEKFMSKLIINDMSESEKKLARKSGKIGLTARGVVLAMVGFFFIQTAITSNPDQSKGLDGALGEIASQPYGQVLLGLAAAGLVLYAVYEIIRGRYARMNFGKNE